jgi:hypothetical protein
MSLIIFLAYLLVFIFSLGYSLSITKNTIEKNENVLKFQDIIQCHQLKDFCLIDTKYYLLIFNKHPVFYIWGV